MPGGLTRWRCDKAPGKKIGDFVTPGSREALGKCAASVLGEGAASAVPYRYVKRDGTVIEVLPDSVVTKNISPMKRSAFPR